MKEFFVNAITQRVLEWVSLLIIILVIIYFLIKKICAHFEIKKMKKEIEKRRGE